MLVPSSSEHTLWSVDEADERREYVHRAATVMKRNEMIPLGKEMQQ